MFEQPTKEHQWLHKLIGEWRSESVCDMGPDQEPMKSSGREVVRSLGGLWTLGEGTMGSGEQAGTSLMTLGFDPRTQRFVGTFIASMMTYLWPYEGTLDPSGRILSLQSKGPSFTGGEGLADYVDTIEFVDDNHRILASKMRLESGEWKQFMQANYFRICP